MDISILENTSDVISRQAVIDLLKQMRKDGGMVPWEGKNVFARIRKLPSVQPTIMRSIGELVGYTGEPCPNCGRLRVERYKSGLEICEKCNWFEHEANHNAELGKMVDDTVSRQVAMERLMAQNVIMDGSEYHNGFNAGVNRAQEVIRNLPSVQPEIIHCKDCLYKKICSWKNQGAEFCSFGKRGKQDDSD